MLHPETLCQCDNCEKQWQFEQLDEIHDFWSRVEVGNEIPAGDCPDCGAFCYLIKKDLRP